MSTDLGRLSYFLGLEFLRVSEGIILHQAKYDKEVLAKFDLTDCNSAINPTEGNLSKEKDEKSAKVDPTLYRQLIGSLRYLCHSRPDILFATEMTSRFMNEP